MRVPYTVSPEVRRKIFMLSSRRELDPSQIAKIVGLRVANPAEGASEVQTDILMNVWGVVRQTFVVNLATFSVCRHIVPPK